MASMAFARKCALIGAIVALLWAGYEIYFEVNTLDLRGSNYLMTARNIINDAGAYLPHYQATSALHLLLIVLHLPVFVALRFNLKKQDESMAALAFYGIFSYVLFGVMTTFSQLHILPRVVDYLVYSLHHSYPVPPPREFVLYFSQFTGSIFFMTGMIAHLFYAGAMAIFASMLFAREQRLAIAMLLAGAVSIATYAMLARGFQIASFGYFAIGVLQAVVLFNIARRFRKVLDKQYY